MIVPQSRVDHRNYHLLGNQAVGETRRSRMKRVNNVKAHTPSLINQQPGQMVNIKGAKPLGLSKEDGVNTVKNAFAAGGLAFLVNSIGRYTSRPPGVSRLKEGDAFASAILALTVAMIPTVGPSVANAEFKSENLGLAGGLVLGGAGVGIMKSGEGAKWKTVKGPEAARGSLVVAPLAFSTALEGWEGLVKTFIPYSAALTGLWLSSKYVPAVRGK